jgi:hypothetical protein
VGISFKGSGFYSTDYSKKGPKETATKDASTSTNGEKGPKDKKDKENKEKSGSSSSSGNKD